MRPAFSMVWFVLGCVVAVVPSARAADLTATPAATLPADARSALPPIPRPTPGYFRALLALSSNELDAALARVAEPVREKLRMKLQEYAGLSPGEREARLRATELHWYLAPLMQMSPTNRAAQLNAIPAEYRSLVEERLRQWDALPPETRQIIRQNQWTFRHFVQLQSPPLPHPTHIVKPLPPPAREKLESQWNTWQALPPAKRERMCDRFRGYFELPPKEKERTLSALSDTQRRDMEDTLRAFEKLSPEQRRVCVASFREFADMNPDERIQFLSNAERWKAVSAAERRTWQMLVRTLPPLPPGFAQPPLPPVGQGEKAGAVAPFPTGGSNSPASH